MGIAVHCEHCQRSLTARDHLAGKRVKCPSCGNAIRIPETLDDPEVIVDDAAVGQSDRAVPTAVAPTAAADAGAPPAFPVIRPTAARRTPAKRAPRRRSSALLAAGAVLLLSVGIGIGMVLSRSGNGWDDPAALAINPPQEETSTRPTDEGTRADKIGAAAGRAGAGRETGPMPRPAPKGPDAGQRPGGAGAAERKPAAANQRVEPTRGEPRRSAEPRRGTEPRPAEVQRAEASVAVAASEPADTIRFAPLALDEPASTMTMSEDGRLLFLAHEGSGTITVWDIAQGSAAATITTDFPRALLSRGNMLYVANHGKGTISLFDETKAWQLSRMVDVDHKGIVHLSAPGGSHFSSTLLATCHGEGTQASYQDAHTYLVDTRRGRSEAIRKDALAGYSYDGKFVITQGSFNLSPSGNISAFPAATYPRPSAQPTMRGGISQTPFVYQVHAGTWWIATNSLFAAPQFNLVRDEMGRVIVPDLSRKVIYAVSENSVTAHQLNVALTELDSRRVTLPRGPSEEINRISQFLYRHRDYRLDHPLAWTNGDQVDLFLLDLHSGEVLHARTNGFAVSSSASTPQSPQAESGKELAGGAPASPSGESAAELLAGFPELLIEGRLAEHQFPNPEARLKFSLVTGPEGITVSEDGRFQWQPTAEDIGRHRLRIRVIDGSEPFVEEPQVQVVPHSLAEAVGGDLARLRPEVMELDLDPVLLHPSRDRQSLMLVQGDRLRVLSGDGFTVEATRGLGNRYQHFDARDNEYIGVIEGTHTLEILDKQSLRSTKQIDLAALGHRVLEVTDLVAHPTRRVSYVGIKHDIDVPRYLVLAINEETGKAEGEPLLGTWLAIDDSGRELVTGYRDLYRSGTRFHINPNWNILTTPSYGNIDMLIRYEVGSGQPKMRQILYEAGGNGSGIRLSPDGQRVTYLSFVGFPKHSKNLPGFDTGDLEQPPVAYASPDGQTPKDLAFHPTHPIVAIPSSNSVVLLDRENGKELTNRFHLLDGGLDDVEIQRLIFSPDGNSLLLLAPGGPTGRQMLKVNLDLSGLKATQPRSSRPSNRSESAGETPSRPADDVRSLGTGI